MVRGPGSTSFESAMMSIEYVEVESLILDPQISFRNLDNADLKPLIKSLKKQGLILPITISPDNKVINGFLRVLAFKKLGWKMIAAQIFEIK